MSKINYGVIITMIENSVTIFNHGNYYTIITMIENSVTIRSL